MSPKAPLRHHNLSGMTVELFSNNYVVARQRFRDAASRLRWTLEAHAIGHSGPSGEDLTIDVAMSPGAREDCTLVLSSGLHGVEGFFGSAVQLGLLQRWAADEALPMRCVMLHALNPYGFAWRRRVNEDNVDLNRNLLPEGGEYSGSPEGYAALDGLLNPRGAPSHWEPVRAKLLLAIARHGLPTLMQAVAGGQYDFPQGLFYGGAEPSRTLEILSANYARWVGQASFVVHLDFHTGLGKRGHYELLRDGPISEASHARLVASLGSEEIDQDSASPSSYTTRGSFGHWCASRLPGCDYSYLAAEFGTYPVLRVLTGLRAENQAHHWAPPGGAVLERTRADLLELFCPRDARWREQVITRAYDLVERVGRTCGGRG